MDLGSAINLYALTKAAEGCKPKTINGYRYNLELFADLLPNGPNTQLDIIKGSDVSQMMVSEFDRGMSVSTVRSRHRTLTMFFDWLADSEEAGYPPSPMRTRGGKIRPQAPARPEHKPRCADPEDVDRLIASIPQSSWVDLRDRAIIQAMRSTGVRVGDLVALRVSCLDMSNRFMMVYGGKGDKDREIPFSLETATALSLYIMARPSYPTDRLLLSGGTRGELTVPGIQQMLKRRCLKAGIDPINPHSLRHMFATKALNDGVPLPAISQILGHSSVSFTAKIYARWNRKGVQRQYDQYWVE